MRKITIFIIALILALSVCSLPAAAYEAVGVDVWVEIVNGGTAVMTAQVNCPLPEQSTITLDNGEQAAFHINFTEEGEYSYYINVIPDERGIIYDTTVYNVKCYMSEIDGKLYVTTVIYNVKTGNKYERPGSFDYISVGFENLLEQPTEPTVPVEAPTVDPSVTPSEASSEHPTEGAGDNPTQASSDPRETPVTVSTEMPDQSASSRPKTGDNSILDIYLLICIAASAGLFALSIGYTVDTNKREDINSISG